MATTTTTSILNTPQAVDDYYGYTETQVLDSNNILTLDVMSNDLGGKAKTLYAIEASEEFIQALATQDKTGEANAQYFNGLKVWIDGGKIMVDVSGADALAALGAQSIEDLDAGQQLDLSFAYTIRLGNGTLSVATVHLTITGEGTDAIVGSSGSDHLVGTAGNDVILAGAGNDVVDGGDGDDQIDGGEGYDILQGGAGNDTLSSGPGGGILNGGAGSDTLVGGDGSEAFVFDSVPSNPPVLLLRTMSAETTTYSLMAMASEPVPMDTSGVDTVVDFNAGVGTVATWDRFVLKGDSFANLAVDANGVLAADSFTTYDGSVSAPPSVEDYARILLNSAENALYYQALDGSMTKFAQLEGLKGIVDATDFAVISTSAHVVETNAVVEAGGLLGVGQTYAAVSGAGTGGGAFSVSANGAWTYQGTSAHDELAAGQVFTDTYTLADGTVLNVDVTGTNDSAVVTQNFTLSFNETDVAQTRTSATLVTATDVDDGHTGNTLFVAQSGIRGTGPQTYGTFTINQSGQWSYKMDSAMNQLAFGQFAQDSAVVHTEDGTAVTLTVKIVGTNDRASIGGQLDATISEDSTGTSATLSIFDIDSANTVYANSSMVGQYGTFTLVPGAVANTYDWTYTPDLRAQALAEGQVEHDYLQVVSADGSAVRAITVTLEGKNDTATVMGTTTGTVAEDGTSMATGQIAFSDPDTNESGFQPPTSLAGDYGQFDIQADGTWHYTLNSNDDRVQVLNDGETLSDHLTVMSLDGSASTTLDVTIQGADEKTTATFEFSGSAHVGEVLTFGIDSLDAPNGLMFVDAQWQFLKDGNWYDIEGMNGRALFLDPSKQLAEGMQVRVHLLLTDQNEETSNIYSSPVTVLAFTGDTEAKGTVLAVLGSTDPITHQLATIVADTGDVQDPNGGVASVNYQWQKSANPDDPDSWENIGGATSAILDAKAPELEGVHVRVLVQSVDQLGLTTDFVSNDQFIPIPNHFPSASPVTLADGFEDMPLTISASDLRAGASDVDGDALTVTDLQLTSGGGSLVATDDGWTYTPAADASGQVTFSYTVSDGHLSATSSASVQINATNDAPVANPDDATTDENSVVAIKVLTNDTDVDAGDQLTLVSALAPAGKGTAWVSGNLVMFDPGSDFDGLAAGQSDVFTIKYKIQDLDGQESFARVTITVTGTDDAPITVADAGSGLQNERVIIDVLDNDSLPDRDVPLTVTGASVPQDQGTVSIVNNQVVFDPGTDFDHLAAGHSSQVTINYTVADEHGATTGGLATVTITGTNDGPHAENDVASTSATQSVVIDVLANDTDPDDGDTFTIVDASALSGSVSIVNNQLVYVPSELDAHLEPGQFSTTRVDYTIRDVAGATSTASVDLTIRAESTDQPLDNITGTYGNALLVTVTEPPTGTVAPVTGDITFTDADISQVYTVSTVGSAYGTLTATIEVSESDLTLRKIHWTFTPDTDAIESLGLNADDVGHLLTDAFGYPSPVGFLTLNNGLPGGSTAFGLVMLVNGADDAPTTVVSGDLFAALQDYSTKTNPAWAAAGTLSANLDSDPSDDFLATTGTGVTGALGHGTFTVASDGSWHYTLDNGSFTISNSIHGIVDSTTVSTADGTTQTIYVTYGASMQMGTLGPDTLTGTSSSDILMGLASNDVLHGGDGIDQLFGGVGSDILWGGTGSDQMTGGTGKDFFFFAEQAPTDGGGGDVITDFDVTEDVIVLYTGEGSPYESLASTDSTSVLGHSVTYDGSTGSLNFSDGSNSFLIATLGTGLVLTNSNLQLQSTGIGGGTGGSGGGAEAG